MFWITLIFMVIAAWAILSLVAVDHADRVNRLQNRLREEAEQASQGESAQAIPVVGGPSGATLTSPEQ